MILYQDDLAVDVCDVFFFRQSTHAPHPQYHAKSLQSKDNNTAVVVDDMPLE